MPVSGGEFHRPGGEFLFHVEKEPKDARGQAQIDFGCASADMTLVPWTPILRGPQLGKLGGYRKGAGGQGIGFRSMTAAAELPVTFGQCFYRLEARLLGWWGSSAAQGSGVS